jgi:hypothetical protein
MTAKPGTGFKVWTAVLSLTFALLLFPAIVGRHGVVMALLYTGLGVGLIWLLYFGIGRFFEWAISEKLKRRSRNGRENGHKGDPAPPK